ncbi:MAG: prepilin-type N-terminal cleavage/methylation domain-containing protein [Planctomycetaceae bacterium]|jgi:prepilin-type N-terminal cleavage/methylation domain-containing protein|nr:prepilin-type N-terminal cleavage/methylation domain-containing protein [Planctomycetaceae bacterium]
MKPYHPFPQNKPNLRTAFTLVELIAVMAILSVTVGTSTMLLFKMFDFHIRYAESAAQLESTNRLVARFRSDIHTNGQPEISPDGSVLLTWQNAGQEIMYILENGAFPEKKIVRREVRRNGERVNMETYHLPDHTKLGFAEGTDRDAGLTAMSLWTLPPGKEAIVSIPYDPFTRTVPSQSFGPSGYWRTVLVRHAVPVRDTADINQQTGE